MTTTFSTTLEHPLDHFSGPALHSLRSGNPAGKIRTWKGRTPEGGNRPLHAGQGLAESITKLGPYAFVTLDSILALALIGVELQNLAIIAGALGIGVGFGLQNVVNNFASGLILLFERPVRAV